MQQRPSTGASSEVAQRIEGPNIPKCCWEGTACALIWPLYAAFMALVLGHSGKHAPKVLSASVLASSIQRLQTALRPAGRTAIHRPEGSEAYQR